jgi:hypothetical protein
MTLNWDEIEKDSQSKYLKITDGQTVSIEFLSEPEKSKDTWGKTRYFCTVMVENQVLSWSFSPLLMHEIGEVLKKPATLIKKTILVSRTGSNKDDTRYTVKEGSK